MATTQAYLLDGVTVGATELSIVSGTTTLQTVTGEPGTYQLWIDGSTLAKGDSFRVRVYEMVKASGTKRLAWQYSISNAQAELFVAPALILLHGWDVTLQKLAGSDRALTASLRKIA